MKKTSPTLSTSTTHSNTNTLSSLDVEEFDFELVFDCSIYEETTKEFRSKL